MSVRIETVGEIATIVICRPRHRNAVDRATAEALADAFRSFAADPELRVAVLWGEGGSFCAGADLHAVGTPEANRLEPEGDAPMGPSRMALQKPIVAAIEGYAVAGGLELALLCDLRVAAEDATLGVFCRRFGVPLIDGGSVRLPRVVGLGRALDLILTGRAVGAEEALAMGLVNRVVPAGRSREVAEELARSIAAHPQACMLSDRGSVYAGLDLSLADGLAQEFRRGLDSLRREGAAGAARFRAGAGRHGEADASD